MVKDKEKRIKINKIEEGPGEYDKLTVREPFFSWHPMEMMRRMDEEFDEFRRDMERAFCGPSIMRKPIFSRHADFRSPDRLFPDMRYPDIKRPVLDIRDTGKELILEAEMPGIPKENIEIELTDELVKVSGKIDTNEVDEKEGYYRQERHYSNFYREMPLPEEIIPGKSDAQLEDGILKIILPKKAPSLEQKSHKLKVK